MSRLNVPGTIVEAPAKSQPMLEGVKKQLGVVPNLFDWSAIALRHSKATWE